MRIDEVTRRGVLGAAVGALGASSAKAGPYVSRQDMTIEQEKFYSEEIPKLKWRAIQVLGNLRVALGKIDQNALKKIEDIKLIVTYYSGLAAAVTSRVDSGIKEFWLDVTVYWDLPDDTIACTLGHEIAHFVLNHDPEINDKKHEHEADVWGARLAQRAGYSVEQALRGIYEAGSQFGRGSGAHPSYAERLMHLRRQGFPLAMGGTFHPQTSKK